MLLHHLCLLYLLFLAGPSEQIDLVVDLPEGRVQGYSLMSRDGRDFAAFEGLPYGEEPGRFLPPVPKQGWEGTLDCTAPGSGCSQV